MTLAGNYVLNISALGVNLQGSLPKTATEGIDPIDTTLPAGKAGTIIRSDANTGVVTASTGHGFTNGDKLAWHSANCVRYDMDATVDGNAITIDGGAGDDLPATAATPGVLTKEVSFDVTFDGDNLVLIGASLSLAGHIRFVDGGGATLYPKKLLAGLPWGWCLETGLVNPLTGNAVATVKASNGSSVAASLIKLTGLQY